MFVLIGRPMALNKTKQDSFSQITAQIREQTTGRPPPQSAIHSLFIYFKFDPKVYFENILWFSLLFWCN